MTMRVWPIVLVFLFVGPLSASDKGDWSKAMKLGTVVSFEEYLTKHPTGDWASSAKTKVAELEYQDARKRNTLAAYQAYLQRFPESTLVPMAKAEMEKLVLEGATKASDYREFLANYPNSALAKIARQRLMWALQGLLVEAIKQGDKARIAALIKDGADPYDADICKEAVKQGSQEIIEQLLTVRPEAAGTIRYLAAADRKLPLLRWLVSKYRPVLAGSGMKLRRTVLDANGKAVLTMQVRPEDTADLVERSCAAKLRSQVGPDSVTDLLAVDHERIASGSKNAGGFVDVLSVSVVDRLYFLFEIRAKGQIALGYCDVQVFPESSGGMEVRELVTCPPANDGACFPPRYVLADLDGAY